MPDISTARQEVFNTPPRPINPSDQSPAIGFETITDPDKLAGAIEQLASENNALSAHEIGLENGRFYDFVSEALWKAKNSILDSNFKNHLWVRHGRHGVESLRTIRGVLREMEVEFDERGVQNPQDVEEDPYQKYEDDTEVELKIKFYKNLLNYGDFSLPNYELVLNTNDFSKDVGVFPYSYYLYLLWSDGKLKETFEDFIGHLGDGVNEKASLLMATVWGGEEMIRDLDISAQDIVGYGGRFNPNRSLQNVLEQLEPSVKKRKTKIQPFVAADYREILSVFNSTKLMGENEGESLLALPTDTSYRVVFWGFNELLVSKKLIENPLIKENVGKYLYRLLPQLENNQMALPEVKTAYPVHKSIESNTPTTLSKDWTREEIESYYFPTHWLDLNFDSSGSSSIIH